MTLIETDPTRAKVLLAESGQHELRKLAVVETVDSIILEGRVTTFYLKQMAQEVVKPATDGRKLVNRVNVED